MRLKKDAEPSFLLMSLDVTLGREQPRLPDQVGTTTRHFTVSFTIYLTPESGTKHWMFLFSLSFRSGKKSHLYRDVVFWELQQRAAEGRVDFTLYKYILFSCGQWNKCLLQNPRCVDGGKIVVPKKTAWQHTTTVFTSAVLGKWTIWMGQMRL